MHRLLSYKGTSVRGLGRRRADARPRLSLSGLRQARGVGAEPFRGACGSLGRKRRGANEQSRTCKPPTSSRRRIELPKPPCVPLLWSAPDSLTRGPQKLQELIRRGTPKDLAAAQELMKVMSGAVRPPSPYCPPFLPLTTRTGTREATGLRAAGAKGARSDTAADSSSQRDAQQRQTERAVRGRRCVRRESCLEQPEQRRRELTNYPSKSRKRVVRCSPSCRSGLRRARRTTRTRWVRPLERVCGGGS